jgi:hypothetical protein
LTKTQKVHFPVDLFLVRVHSEMPSSALPVSESPTLLTVHSPDPPVSVPSTDMPTTSLPTTNPVTVTGANEVDPANDVAPAMTTSVQTAEPSGGASAAIVNVPEAVPTETHNTEINPVVLAPAESVPVVAVNRRGPH